MSGMKRLVLTALIAATATAGAAGADVLFAGGPNHHIQAVHSRVHHSTGVATASKSRTQTPFVYGDTGGSPLG